MAINQPDTKIGTHLSQGCLALIGKMEQSLRKVHVLNVIKV